MKQASEVAARRCDVQPLIESVMEKMQSEVVKLGFPEDEVILQQVCDAKFDLEKDPFSGEHSLVGQWLNDKGYLEGKLTFRNDGSFFVEQDIARMYPGKDDIFVEAVNAWGREGNIKAEARLIKVPFL